MSEGNGVKVDLESKVDKLLIIMLELVRSFAAIEEQQIEIIEKLDNLNLGDGFTYGQES